MILFTKLNDKNRKAQVGMRYDDREGIREEGKMKERHSWTVRRRKIQSEYLKQR